MKKNQRIMTLKKIEVLDAIKALSKDKPPRLIDIANYLKEDRRTTADKIKSLIEMGEIKKTKHVIYKKIKQTRKVYEIV